jgi:hypothetical protein
VRILEPFGEVQLDPALRARFNPLDVIDPAGDLAIDDAGRIAAAIRRSLHARLISRADCRSSSTTDGWSEGVHKRALLNPDELGRFFARVAMRLR